MLTIIDCSHVIHPMFWGLPKMARPSDDHPVNVVHGMLSTFWHLTQSNPSHVVAVYDSPTGSAGRKKTYPSYKANRPPVPDALKCQLPLARRAADAFGFARAEHWDYEADDIIATYVRLAREAGHEVSVISSDKDLFPLIDWDVTLFDPVRKKTVDRDGVKAKFGVYPDKMADLLALWGDTSDNIEGVRGIGPKKAAALLEQYGNLDAILDNIASIKQPPLRLALEQDGWKARLSRKHLIQLNDQVPVDRAVEDLAYTGFDRQAVMDFINEMELVTLKEEIEAALREAA